jgi:hypothetical protein
MLQRPGWEQKPQSGATGPASGVNPRGMQAHSLRARVLGQAAVPDDPGLNRRCVATGGEDRRTLDHMTTVRPRSGQPRHGRQDQIRFRRIRVLPGTA